MQLIKILTAQSNSNTELTQWSNLPQIYFYLNFECGNSKKRNYSEIYNIINEYETQLNFSQIRSSFDCLFHSRSDQKSRYLKSPSDISPLSLSSSSRSHTQLLSRSVFMLHSRQDTRGGRPLSVHFTLGPRALHNAITRLSLTICVVDYNKVHGKYKLHTFYLNVFC